MKNLKDLKEVQNTKKKLFSRELIPIYWYYTYLIGILSPNSWQVFPQPVYQFKKLSYRLIY